MKNKLLGYLTLLLFMAFFVWLDYALEKGQVKRYREYYEKEISGRIFAFKEGQPTEFKVKLDSLSGWVTLYPISNYSYDKGYRNIIDYIRVGDSIHKAESSSVILILHDSSRYEYASYYMD